MYLTTNTVKVILLCLLTTLLMGQNDIEPTLTLAHNAYDSQNYEEALSHFQTVLTDDTTNVKVYERAGLSAFRLGDLPIAKELFTNLVAKDSMSMIGLSSLATIFDQENNTPKAIKYYHSLIKYYPDNAINYRKLAQQYQRAGLQKFAVQYYAEALEKNNRDSYAIKGLSELYLRDRKYSKADSLLTHGLKQDSMNISLNLLKAQNKYLQKAYDSTVYYMEVIRGKYDFRPHQNKMIGYAYVQIDSLDKAIHYLTQAINDPGTKEYAHYNLGVAYEKKGDTEYALHHFQEAVKAGISEDIDLYHRNVARLYSSQEDLKSAIPHYQDAYKYGEDPIVLFYLGRASDNYYKDKNIAIRYYTKFLNSTYEHPEYKDYSKKRIRYLKEYQHQNN